MDELRNPLKDIMSSQTDKIAEAMCEFQANLDCIQRDKVNGHFKSSYASIDCLLKNVRKQLAQQGMSVNQHIHTRMLCEDCNINTAIPHVVTVVNHKSGQWYSSTMPIIPDKKDITGLKSNATSIKGLCLKSILALSTTDEEEDDDGAAATFVNKSEIELLNCFNTDYQEKLRIHYNLKRWEDMRFVDYKKIMENFIRKSQQS